jgi:cysteine-rich repeat protein
MQLRAFCRLARTFLFLAPVACHPQGQPGVTTAEDPSTSGTPSFGDLPPPDEPTTSGPSTGAVDPGSTGPSSTGVASTGAASFCGDGIIDPGEQCDDGADNSDTGVCTHKCLTATCGDGNVWAGVEECDLGDANSADYAGCSIQCTWNPRCGDGKVDPDHENCDMAELNGSGKANEGEAPCSAACQWQARLVFLSSKTYDGALGGVSGADLKCRALAQANGLVNASKYRAWLSDGLQSPLSRFDQITLEGLPYALRNGKLVAADFTELVEDGPRTGIWITESGSPLFERLVWTNTTAFGEPFSPTNHCADWTASSMELFARVGRNAVATEQGPDWDVWRSERQWTSFLGERCNKFAHLYCFEDGQDDGVF